MTEKSTTEKFDLRWTLLIAVVVMASSASLLQLSVSSGAFVALSAVGIVLAGSRARGVLGTFPPTRYFIFGQRIRLAGIALIVCVAIARFHASQTVLVAISAFLLWTVAINTCLQIAARYAEGRLRLLPYVQYIGDYWIAIFLAIWGANWLIVAGVLVFASTSALTGIAERDSKLFALIALSSAGLLIIGTPPAVRAFAAYLTAAVILAAWSADHLMALAMRLRGLTASASDGSTTR